MANKDFNCTEDFVLKIRPNWFFLAIYLTMFIVLEWCLIDTTFSTEPLTVLLVQPIMFAVLWLAYKEFRNLFNHICINKNGISGHGKRGILSREYDYNILWTDIERYEFKIVGVYRGYMTFLLIHLKDGSEMKIDITDFENSEAIKNAIEFGYERYCIGLPSQSDPEPAIRKMVEDIVVKQLKKAKR